MQLPGPCHSRPKAGETLTALQGDSKMGSSSPFQISLPLPCLHRDGAVTGARNTKPQGSRTAVLPHIGSTPSGRWLVPTLTEAKAAPRGVNNEADVHKAVPGSQWSCQGNANHFTDREGTKATHKNESCKPSPCRKQAAILSILPKALLCGHTGPVKMADSYRKNILEGALPER